MTTIDTTATVTPVSSIQAPNPMSNFRPTGGNNLWAAHNEWANRPEDERFQTLAALTERVKSRRMRARSNDATLSDLKITAEGGSVYVNGTTTRATPTNWSFGQLSASLGAPAGYLRKLPAQLAADCLMNGVKNSPKEAMKFMSLSNDDDNAPRTLQAVTSPTYGRIWDADVAEMAGRIVERTNGRFHNPLAYKVAGRLGGETVPSGLYASDRDIFIFMIDGGSLLEIGDRAKLNRGFFLWNSEVGSKTFGLTTFLFNVVCGNHIVWGAEDVNTWTVRHTKNGPYRFDGEATPRLMNYIESSAKPLEDAIRRATEYSIAKELGEPITSKLSADQIQLFLATRVKGAKFTKAEAREAMETAMREEGKCETLWDLSQGMTAYARGFDFMDARTELETRAGRILDLAK